MNQQHEDILIGRVVDDEATPADWQALESLAGADARVWGRLAAAQREHDALRAAFDRATEVAELVEVCPRATAAVDAMAVRWRAWSGWAAAAVLALAWAGAGGLGLLNRPSSGPVQHASLVSSLTPDEALGQYLAAGQAQGRVLGELPKVMVETRPTEEGQRVEVLFIRQIYERTVVSEMMEFSQDEFGRPVYHPVSTTPFSSPESL